MCTEPEYEKKENIVFEKTRMHGLAKKKVNS